MPAIVHTYYHAADEDPTPHMAAFLLARSEQWYFLGSTGWWDDSFRWSQLFDTTAKCGKPLGPPVAVGGGAELTRAFEGCNVSLDCTNASACVGTLAVGVAGRPGGFGL